MLGWSWSDAAPLTHRQLVHAYDAKILHDWDMTASTLAMLDGLACILINIHSKRAVKVKQRSAIQFHPYREHQPTGLKIDGSPESMNTLQSIFDSAFGKVI